MNSRDLIKELKQAGWTLKRTKGSYHQFSHPDHSHVVTVPHPKKDLGRSLVKAIRKQAGLEKSNESAISDLH
ncbi:MAG: type II toxin-antitoxin system HicA family toxin [Pseudomonadota bacterium]|nr:type II toxin-antitoxin system HicA family toxin [Pseudomonadota bacterium]